MCGKNETEEAVCCPKLHPFDCVPWDIEAKWVLDIGANVGDVAAAALESYPGSSVICFEPVEGTFNYLKNRLSVYGDRVILYKNALSDAAGETEINLTSFHGANSILPQAQYHKTLNPHVRETGKEKVGLVRLDDIYHEFPSRCIDIVKVDVEGYEMNVLKGAKEFLMNCADTVIIEVALMRDPTSKEQAVFSIFSLMKELGFSLVNIYDIHYTKPEHNVDIILAQMDCVFRRQQRLRQYAIPNELR